MNVYVALLIGYSAALTGLGLWIGRHVRGASDFFVAGRRLTWPLVGATVLAANIGAGTTVGAAGQAYHDGISALWWNGAVGIGTLILAFVVGPRLWKIAADHGLLTAGDFLERRYSTEVRVLVAALIMLGTLAILAAQLIAGAAVLEVVAGLPRWQGVVIGGAAMTIYFTAGGLLSSAWVNAVQLVVLITGFLIALPMVLGKIGGTGAIAAAGVPATFWDPLYSAGPSSGWTFLILLTPSFIISPGLVQKAYGAVDARAVRVGIGAAGFAQLAFSFLPVLLGMAARVNHPAIDNPNLVLPTVLLNELPTLLGALALAAIFSAEVSTCDAILFMLSTSASKDLYHRFINPSASPAQLLAIARGAAVAGGIAGMVLAVKLATIIDALRIFYAILGTTMFVPVAGALLVPRATARDAKTAILFGITALLAVHFGTDRKGWADPSLWGLIASAAGFALSLVLSRSRELPRLLK